MHDENLEIIIAFLDAVYEGKGELVAASFDEKAVLTDATQLINDLREKVKAGHE